MARYVAIGVDDDADGDGAATAARAETSVHATDRHQIAKAQRVQPEPSPQLSIRQLDVGVAENPFLSTEAGSHQPCGHDVRDWNMQVRAVSAHAPAGKQTRREVHGSYAGMVGEREALTDRNNLNSIADTKPPDHARVKIDQQVVDAPVLAGHRADSTRRRAGYNRCDISYTRIEQETTVWSTGISARFAIVVSYRHSWFYVIRNKANGAIADSLVERYSTGARDDAENTVPADSIGPPSHKGVGDLSCDSQGDQCFRICPRGIGSSW
jgi:hypothetical protein